MNYTKQCRAAISFLVLCKVLITTSAVRGDALTFTVDSTQSYLTLNIPNFASGTVNLNLTGQNRTNGAPISTAWSASTTTGNTAFISGTIATTVGGSLSGQTLSAIQFISGANSLAAINSGNYRPNPAAYNAVTSVFNNNVASPGAYGTILHTQLGNVAIISFDNVTYDIGSNSALPASDTTGSGTFVMNDPSNPLNAGILNSLFSQQGLALLLSAFPSGTGNLDGVLGANTDASGTYSFLTKSELRITIPINVPISMNIDGLYFLNGNATGQLVANALVPEPATLVLAGLAFASLNVVAPPRRPI